MDFVLIAELRYYVWQHPVVLGVADKTLLMPYFYKTLKHSILSNFAWAKSKENVYFKFHKVHFRLANSDLLLTKSALLHCKECFNRTLKHSLQCNKALFVDNKAQFPTCSSAG